MPKQQTSRTWLVIFLIVIVLIAVLFWFLAKKTTASVSNSNGVALNPTASESSAQNQAMAANLSTSSRSNSQTDTQIDCQIKLNFRHKLVVNEQTRDCYEYFITQYGEKNFAQIDQDLKHYAQMSFQAPASGEIIDLWSRYLKYREALGQLSVPSVNPNDSSYYQNVLTATQTLRQKFFSSAEVAGLFGNEDLYDDYTLKRMQVLQNTALTSAEKATRLKSLLEDLPKSWREQIKQQTVVQDLHQLTAELKAQHATPEQIQDMRIDLVGREAAQRLETLDQNRQAWNSRVSQYLTERDNILKSNDSDSSKQQQIQQLQQQQFSTQQERIRLKAFETTHDQGNSSLLN
ncbi:lipase secretion chaperone [Acinetobacter sp. MD2(2019)]|uniref:lipase secretion chaperone n=1 Tax=Acinetobacter sp. MD2(2019) TaxID=2605273 RepID=UPI002D1E840D|nr:lipase secretion chaperone [Acinetobacter sp. MD2(2019)]MEB3753260.1 lipase secretion chaperone [Acinetobacter sp. MD2(2019)]